MVNKIAIIGLGSIGYKHFRLIKEIKPNISIIAVRSNNRKKLAEHINVDKEVFNIDDAIKFGVQAAIIATPSVNHFNETLKLLNAGIHILVEKPLSDSIEGLDSLIDCWNYSNKIGLVGYCFRYDPAFQFFKKLLEDKKTGNVLHVQVVCSSYLPNWRIDKNYKKSVSALKELGGGVLLELSHEIDYVNWFFGPIKSVHAVLNKNQNLGLNVEENADLILKNNAGFSISIHLDFNSQIDKRECIVRCSNGNLILNVNQKSVMWYTADGIKEKKNFEHDEDEKYRLQLKHFFECIENKKQPKISLLDGYNVMRIIDAAKKSNLYDKSVII